MTTSFQPAASSEFPNDNPELHTGARWVCRSPLGAARALLRLETGAVTFAASLAVVVPPAPLADAEVPPTERVVAPLEPPAAAQPEPLAVAAPAPVERTFEGPLQLDLGRIVLVHRVENVPPPPDFIFRPFVSSRRAPPPVVVPAIEPRPCRIVDEREAHQRVDRGWRVDVAPCLSIGEVIAAGPEVLRRQPRRRGTLAARPVSAPDASPAPAPLELEAVSA